jgi:hypothetical protein
MGEPSQREVAQQNENLLEQVKLHLDVYKTHFDLFVKAMALYFAALGAVAGFIYGKDANQASQALSIVIVIGSLAFLAGCVASYGWVKQVEESVRKAEDWLKIHPFPFSGAKGVITAMGVACAVFAVLAALKLFGVLKL